MYNPYAMIKMILSLMIIRLEVDGDILRIHEPDYRACLVFEYHEFELMIGQWS